VFGSYRKLVESDAFRFEHPSLSAPSAVPERVAALAGGVGAARLLRGVATLVAAGASRVIVNTADDEEFYGLHVSPDLDTIVYTLAGVALAPVAGASG